jgi:hypothetical protein
MSRLCRLPVRRCLAPLASLLLPSCAQWGGAVLEDNHVAFNTSVADAMDRQMLLNIVRMNLDEPTQWLSVSNINVTQSVNAKVTGSATIPTTGAVAGGTGGETGFAYSPNITFVPLKGEQLARELMSPVPVSSIENMVSAAWPISWVLFLTCERVQVVDSFDVTRGFVIQSRDPRFGRLMELMDELQRQQLVSLSQVAMPVTWNQQPIADGEVNLGRVIESKRDKALLRQRPEGGYDYVSIESVPVLTLYPGSEKIAAGQELMKMLDLGDEPGSFRMVAVESPVPGSRVSIRTRSVASIMRLMSFGVDPVVDAPPPSADVDCPAELWAHLKLSSEQPTSDVARNVNAVFRVHRTLSLPAEAIVSVKHRGQWFWISRDDITARQVFALVRDLFDLQVKSGAEAQPVLTVPVGIGR